MSKKKTTMQLRACDLVPGQFAQANDGEFYEVVSVDPILDPRGGVYESQTEEAVVCFSTQSSNKKEILRGLVSVRQAA